MKIFTEDQLQDDVFRKTVIQEILGPENVERKREHLKRYEIFKDMTKKYVTLSLLREGLAEETVTSMENRAGNISLCRKVVNKLARTYSGGVVRVVEEDEETTKQISELSRLLKFDEKMKKSDRYRELHKNNAIQIVPEKVSDPSDEPSMFKLKMRVLNPWQYDVVEDGRDREIPRVYILSDFLEQNDVFTAASEEVAGRHPARLTRPSSDNRDATIADDPRDEGKDNKRTFIWWSEKWHFTTDETGAIIPDKSPEDMLNPIQMVPFINNAEDQDGFFWAQGGDDLISGSILVNKLMTDMFYIAYLQGFGQYVITGKNLKERIKIGPNNAIVLDYDPEQGDPKPSVDVISANPPLDSWMKSVEQYVALLLTTNNLSPSNISTTLDAQNFPSGIAMLIEKSEATDDISDKQKEYKDIERNAWEIIRLWNNLIFDSADSFTEDFEEVGQMPNESFNLNIKFNELKPVISETEKLANLKLRKDLGLNEEIDLLMIDNPDLTIEEAEEKLLKIKEEKANRMGSALRNAIMGEDDERSQEQEETQEAETEAEKIETGVTSRDGADVLHTHGFRIDGEGNGSTTSTSDGPGHTHQIRNRQVEPADPGPHSHSI